MIERNARSVRVVIAAVFAVAKEYPFREDVQTVKRWIEDDTSDAVDFFLS